MTIASIEVVKAAELQRALADAQGEIVADVKLTPAAIPSGGALGLLDVFVEGLPAGTELQTGFLIQSRNPDVLNIDALIFQEDGSDIVQFGFVDNMIRAGDLAGFAPSPVAGEGGLYTLGFLPAGEKNQGQALHASGLKSWIPHAALKIGRKLAMDAIKTIAHAVEQKAKPNPGFVAMSSGYTARANDAQLNAANGQRVLLFVHGIFSSIEGGFHALGDSGQNSTLKTLLDRYKGNVFGYDHWTISKTPLENAVALLEAIPSNANWKVDLVCHSRGGLITRALFANPADNSVLQIEELRKIQKLRQDRIANVGEVIFVAGANQGSPLANPDQLQKFLKIAGVLASKSHCFALDVVIGLLRTLISAAYDIPSVVQLDDKRSQLIADLNAINTVIGANHAYGVRANFDCAGWTWKEAETLVEKWLMPELNDLVVPYTGVASNPFIPEGDHLYDFDQNASQSKVWHTNYFEQPQTHEFLLKHLSGEP
ncbi:Alpha/beta hydrolase [Rhodanobacter sp. Root179]|uniref:esterase/lipase family protein n=1 Tax=Rhodanobacter sp. Root179 TaxID=1736482 RepID=UPI000A8483C4|nr:hypothetical protein [Rhodanobacter sp. Root179]